MHACIDIQDKGSKITVIFTVIQKNINYGIKNKA